MAIVRLDQVAGAAVHIAGSASATLPGGAPTPGDTIVGFLYNSNNGVPPSATIDGTGWNVIADVGNPNNDGAGNSFANVWCGFRKAVAGDTATYTVSAIASSIIDGSLLLVRYSGMATPAIDVKNVGADTLGASAVFPVLTPRPGSSRVLLAFVALTPNYAPAAPGTWTQVLLDGAAGNRQTMIIYEKIVPSVSGSYGGDTIGPGGVGVESSFWIPMAALGGDLGRAMVSGSPGGGVL